MKFKNGFVSNSSTSSFVVLGYKIDDTLENQKKIVQVVNKKNLDDQDEIYVELWNLKDGFTYYSGGDDGIEEGKALVGVGKSFNEEEYIALDLDIDEVMSKIKQLGFDGKVKLFAGIRYS
jgi:hypothetical protein